MKKKTVGNVIKNAILVIIGVHVNIVLGEQEEVELLQIVPVYKDTTKKTKKTVEPVQISTNVMPVQITEIHVKPAKLVIIY